MRKIVYLLALPFLFAANAASAQSFTMQKDTVSVAGSQYFDISNYIHNDTTIAIKVSWRIIQENLPQSWKDNASFGLCDNIMCYTNSVLGGSTQTTDTILADSQTIFKVQLDLGPSTVLPTTSGPVYVTVELTQGSTIDTVTFVAYKWATNISKTQIAKDEITLYPNPAQNEVNVTFGKETGVKTIAIYNLVGKQMVAYRTNGTSAKLDIDKIPSGIYFVRLMDNSGRVVATRRFTHQ